MDEIDENKALKILEACYEKAVQGVPLVSESVADLAEDYIEKYGRTEKAVDKLIANQIAKCGTSGFITGLGGIITMPVTLPANITSVLYVQLRMIAAVAYIKGYDPSNDAVKTLAYICLTGKAMSDVVKKTGIIAANKMALSALNQVSGKALIDINKKVGFRLLAKFGEKSVITLVKLVPVAGGIAGGTFDVATTKIIAMNAKKQFVAT